VRAIVAVACLALALTAEAQVPDPEEIAPADFDRLWDYNDPAATQARFLAIMPRVDATRDAGLRAELLTQIARCQGLQRDFTAAEATLDSALAIVDGDSTVARVRVLLERGRVINSRGEPAAAAPYFREAWEIGRALGADFHAVDAAHMLAIVEPADAAMPWHERAIALAQSSADGRARGWLGSLYNNLGWTQHDRGEYPAALATFEKALALREQQGKAGPIRIARWSVARALRSLARLDEALAMQRALLAELDAAGEQDGFVHEELGECLLALGRAREARPQFARAYSLLAADPWFAEREPARLARLRRLGGQD
jgi:tetratricopeptide (TPR) repeat protein